MQGNAPAVTAAELHLEGPAPIPLSVGHLPTALGQPASCWVQMEAPASTLMSVCMGVAASTESALPTSQSPTIRHFQTVIA